MTIDKSQSKAENWAPCSAPKIGDTLKWNEPLWAAPNKPRGKPDKIGEQEITATLLSKKDFLEFEVIEVKKISSGDASLKVKKDDIICRKKTTIELGNCQKIIKQ